MIAMIPMICGISVAFFILRFDLQHIFDKMDFDYTNVHLWCDSHIFCNLQSFGVPQSEIYKSTNTSNLSNIAQSQIYEMHEHIQVYIRYK